MICKCVAACLSVLLIPIKLICTFLRRVLLCPCAACVSCTRLEWSCPSCLSCAKRFPGRCLTCVKRCPSRCASCKISCSCMGKPCSPCGSGEKSDSAEEARSRCCCPTDLRTGWPQCSDCPSRADCLPTREEVGCSGGGCALAADCTSLCTCSHLCGITSTECLEACGKRPFLPGCTCAPAFCQILGCACAAPLCCCSVGAERCCKMPEEERAFWLSDAPKQVDMSPPEKIV